MTTFNAPGQVRKSVRVHNEDMAGQNSKLPDRYHVGNVGMNGMID
jgi:hypothetical protein